MREIKFRAWFGYIPAMVTDIELGQDYFRTQDKEGEIYKPELYQSDAIMQYTGLKDKNGKEIYEGDVVRVERNPTFDAIVHFNRGAFWLYEHKTNVDKGVFGGLLQKETQWSIGLIEDSTLIGNIHENPELL